MLTDPCIKRGISVHKLISTLKKQQKHRQGMICQKFSQNPYTREKSHHHHLQCIKKKKKLFVTYSAHLNPIISPPCFTLHFLLFLLMTIGQKSSHYSHFGRTAHREGGGGLGEGRDLLWFWWPPGHIHPHTQRKRKRGGGKRSTVVLMTSWPCWHTGKAIYAKNVYIVLFCPVEIKSEDEL